jgi:hypothetical protein
LKKGEHKEPVLLNAVEVPLSELRLENIEVLVRSTVWVLLLWNSAGPGDIWLRRTALYIPEVHDDEPGSWLTQSEVLRMS